MCLVELVFCIGLLMELICVVWNGGFGGGFRLGFVGGCLRFCLFWVLRLMV